jgi:hypothetical protein
MVSHETFVRDVLDSNLAQETTYHGRINRCLSESYDTFLLIFFRSLILPSWSFQFYAVVLFASIRNVDSDGAVEWLAQ